MARTFDIGSAVLNGVSLFVSTRMRLWQLLTDASVNIDEQIQRTLSISTLPPRVTWSSVRLPMVASNSAWSMSASILRMAPAVRFWSGVWM